MRLKNLGKKTEEHSDKGLTPPSGSASSRGTEEEENHSESYLLGLNESKGRLKLCF